MNEPADEFPKPDPTPSLNGKMKPHPPPPLTDAELEAMINSVRKETGIPEPGQPHVNAAGAAPEPPPKMSLDELIDSVPVASPTEPTIAEQLRRAFPYIDGLGDMSEAECDWARPWYLTLRQVLGHALPLPPGIRFKAVLAACAMLLHAQLEMEREMAKRQSETN